MFFIAQRLGVPLNTLIAANPHITNPNLIFPGDVLCVPPAVAPPPPTVECPCPVTLGDFINRRVEVTTACGVVIGWLSSVQADAITLVLPKTSQIIVVPCKQVCFVRVLRGHKGE